MRVALLSVGVTSPAQVERLLVLQQRLDGPVTFAPVAAELVPLLRAQPALAAKLAEAFVAGRLRPLLAAAHGSDARLLDGAELADELRLADELLQSLGAEPCERRGFVGAGGVAALEEAGIDFVLASDLAAAARVGERLLALPYESEDAIIVRANGDDAAALDAAGARVEALVEGGAELVAVATLAARLTPPWLPRTELPSPMVPGAARALTRVCRWLAGAFALAEAPQVAAAALCDEGWRLERLPARARVPLLLRRATAGNRRALVSAFELCDVLSVEARVPGCPPRAQAGDGQELTIPLAELRAWGEANGAGEPFARACAAFAELVERHFLGGARWRALACALRDGFALLSMRAALDWQLVPADDEEEDDDREPTILVEEARPQLRLVDPPGILN